MKLPENAYIRNDGISEANIEYYRNSGFLIAETLLGNEEIEALKSETDQIFRGKRAEVPGLLEMPEDASAFEVLEQYTAIHFPHKLSAYIKSYLSHAKIVAVLKEIISPNVKAMQSMLFVKGPGKAGQSWHQDEYFIPTRDLSLTGVWIAIDDARIENGCLWVIPGSHKPSVIYPRVKNIQSEYADVETLDVSSFGDHAEVPVEVPAGSIVFFNGYLFHSSRKNKTSDKFRRALVNHYMSAESMLPWDQDGNLPPTEDLRDITMVCGMDPYSHKGTVDLNKPFLRQSSVKKKRDKNYE